MNRTDPASIIRWLFEHGIVLAAQGTSLRVRSRAPLTAGVRERIQVHKASLLAHLARPSRVPGPNPRIGPE